MDKCGLSEARRPASTPDKGVMTIKFLRMYNPVNRKARLPAEEEITKMSTLSEESMKSGVGSRPRGICPERRGVRVRLSGGKFSVTDGPFTSSNQIVGGFALIRTKPGEEAIEYRKDLLKNGRRRGGHSSGLRRAGHSFRSCPAISTHDHEGLLQQGLNEPGKK